MKLTTKFFVGVVLVTMGMVIAAGMAVAINQKFNSHVEVIGNELLPSISTFDGLEIDAHRTRALILEMLITDDKGNRVSLAAELDSVGASSTDFLRRFAIDEVNGTLPTPQFKEIVAKRAQAILQAQAVKTLVLKNDISNAKIEWRRMDLSLSVWENLLRDARESALANANRQVTDAALTLKRSQWTVVVGSVTIFAVILLLLTWAYRNIAAPIQNLALELNGFERSPNLKVRFSTHSLSELGVISRSLNKLMDWVDSNAVKLQEQRDQIHHSAIHDHLTDLPLWRLGKDRLELAIAWAHRTQDQVGVMFVDLDGFKAVNDTYGHGAGDFLLREVAQRMKSQLRLEDTVARMGGDEFVVILARQASQETTQQIAMRIIEALAQKVLFETHELHVGVSIGIAIYPNHGRDVDSLLAAADTAMYCVKRSGKNNFAFYSDIS